MKYELFWVSEDKQSSLSGGIFDSRSDAIAAIEEFNTQLFEQAGEESDYLAIEAGTFEVN